MSCIKMDNPIVVYRFLDNVIGFLKNAINGNLGSNSRS